jgi:hypothetical protein
MMFEQTREWQPCTENELIPAFMVKEIILVLGGWGW